MSQRICNSQSEPYWWKPDWHPTHMRDIKHGASRPQYEADSFMTGIAMFLRTKMLGQETARRRQDSAKKFRAQGQRGA